MEFNTSTADELNEGDAYLDVPGTYHFVIEQIREGLSQKDEPLDGSTILLRVCGGEHSGKLCNLTLWNVDLSAAESRQKHAIRIWTNFFLATNVLQPSQLGQKVSLDVNAASGSQVVAKVERQQKQVDGKWVTDPDSKFLRLAYDNVYHVDDPELASTPKDADALSVIDQGHRHDASYFAYKAKPTSAAKPKVDMDDI